VYHEQSKPALDYYKLKGILINIDGSGKIEEIFSKIQKSIED
jgi:adenylate kinase